MNVDQILAKNAQDRYGHVAAVDEDDVFPLRRNLPCDDERVVLVVNGLLQTVGKQSVVLAELRGIRLRCGVVGEAGLEGRGILAENQE